MSEPLSDEEIADRLHRMAFDLQQMAGRSTAGDTALKTANAALLMIMAGLISLSERDTKKR